MGDVSAHYPVLLKESVTALVNDPNGVYIDGTFGRGGHSRAILEKLSDRGRLIAFDKDPDAVAEGAALGRRDKRFSVYHASFAQMKTILAVALPEGKIKGVLMDLGVSSPQLDTPQRGFSFLHDGPLDMRMDSSVGQTAADWLNRADEKEIIFVLREFGEERFARRMAGAVVARRVISPFTTTTDFAAVIAEANPRWEKGKHPATRAFQAVRIFINSELNDLQTALNSAIDLLDVNGRIVVISFHSLEDRIVKRFFREAARGKHYPMSVPVTEEMLDKKLRVVGKAIKADQEEINKNNRSRSAVMRVAERI